MPQAWNVLRSEPKPDPGSRTYAMMIRKARPEDQDHAEREGGLRGRRGAEVPRSGTPVVGMPGKVSLLNER
jgi:hypothetical protein